MLHKALKYGSRRKGEQCCAAPFHLAHERLPCTTVISDNSLVQPREILKSILCADGVNAVWKTRTAEESSRLRRILLLYNAEASLHRYGIMKALDASVLGITLLYGFHFLLPSRAFLILSNADRQRHGGQLVDHRVAT